MPNLLADSQQRFKTGDHKPFFRLVLGPGSLEVPIVSANLTYSLSGTSGMRFVSGKQLSGWENTPAKLHIGYGSNRESIFHGRLAEVKDHPSGLYSEGVAYGITETLGTRYFCERVSYKGVDLEAAYYDIMNRSGVHPDSWEFQRAPGDDNMTIEEDHDILPETSFLEGIGMLIEPFGYEQFDRHRDTARPEHLVKRAPVFGYWRNPIATFKPKHYLKDSFNFKPGLKEFYSRVIVFRRGENTTTDSTEEGTNTPLRYEVYAEHDVQPQNTWRFQPSRTRVMFVPDFMGDQNTAEVNAAKYAKALQNGAGEFEIEIAPVDITINDPIAVHQVEKVTSHRLTKLLEEIRDVDVDVGDTVDWKIICRPEDIEYQLGPGIFTMRVSGRGMKRTYSVVKTNRFKDVIDITQAPLEPGVPPPADPEPPEGGFLTWGDTSPTFADLDMLFSDLD